MLSVLSKKKNYPYVPLPTIQCIQSSKSSTLLHSHTSFTITPKLHSQSFQNSQNYQM
ncbi:hypothetical protein HanRHA438_Chr03g0129371 [Helianthus annuus]|uniref:Uncharacterized protein n=1 Tax=Helianthus annuus TaxID=4232 RepID=A0A251V7H5_HELAN|nr:hypothetical protein HanXRQr2_Chr03g0117511 [Helianthus annuus]KAJ0593545.1 hypothetical protein HanHA300_Chr03g0098191 [Helianthus annuus]KAJ0608557.1 hypothetical protein HanHA89_Chr03g0109911 [Helianthus annuus]KAJ0768624.1 hypothetical protein HanLR1_Chr03g0103291 [Helianthus annuus]KAJ0774368.1 hypothetical protein HanOQP8_Chr03g0110761 [Helianthus annuus]